MSDKIAAVRCPPNPRFAKIEADKDAAPNSCGDY